MFKLNVDVLYIFFMTLILAVLLDLGLTFMIDIDKTEIYHSSIKETHTGVKNVILISIFITFSCVLFIHSLIGKYKLISLFSGLLFLAVAVGVIQYVNNIDYLMLADETLLLMITLLNLRILLAQRKIPFIIVAVFINGGYLWLYHDAESAFFIEYNTIAATVIAIVLYPLLRNCEKYLDDKTGSSEWYELQNKWKSDYN